MTEITEAQFAEASRKIPAALAKQIKDMTTIEGIRHVYNEAITDAVDFTAVLAKKNPIQRLTLQALEKELREKLILRKPE